MKINKYTLSTIYINVDNLNKIVIPILNNGKICQNYYTSIENNLTVLYTLDPFKIY